MTASTISECATAILRQAGWHQGRTVDIGEVLRVLQGQGITPSATAEEFLREFHGLHFELLNGYLDFDVQQATKWLAPDDLSFLVSLVGEPLCPVGYGGRRFILLSPSGRFVFLNDEWMFFSSASSLFDALDMAFLLQGSPNDLVWLSHEQQPPGYSDNIGPETDSNGQECH